MVINFKSPTKTTVLFLVLPPLAIWLLRAAWCANLRHI